MSLKCACVPSQQQHAPTVSSSRLLTKTPPHPPHSKAVCSHWEACKTRTACLEQAKANSHRNIEEGKGRTLGALSVGRQLGNAALNSEYQQPLGEAALKGQTELQLAPSLSFKSTHQVRFLQPIYQNVCGLYGRVVNGGLENGERSGRRMNMIQTFCRHLKELIRQILVRQVMAMSHERRYKMNWFSSSDSVMGLLVWLW